MEAKAKIKNFRSTPRKARLIADFIRGKNVKKVLAELTFLNKKASKGFKSLILSALANSNSSAEDMYVKEVRVDQGQALKRYKAGSNGRALRFKRRLSHISLILSDLNDNKK